MGSNEPTSIRLSHTHAYTHMNICMLLYVWIYALQIVCEGPLWWWQWCWDDGSGSGGGGGNVGDPDGDVNLDGI